MDSARRALSNGKAEAPRTRLGEIALDAAPTGANSADRCATSADLRRTPCTCTADTPPVVDAPTETQAESSTWLRDALLDELMVTKESLTEVRVREICESSPHAEVAGEVVAELIQEDAGGTLFHLAHFIGVGYGTVADYKPVTIERQIVAVLCTWSEGTFPDNAVEFAEALEAVRPDLSGVRFGVCGLGDRDYDPYYQTAAHRLIDLLTASGAMEAVPLHDIDGGPSAADIAGAVDWVTRCATAFAAASPPVDS